MPLTWSPIHAALGEAPGPLTFEMIKACVAQNVTEQEDLDWKQALPPKEEERLTEFAKDVAAMANTRGGLLVYGVAEERGKGTARAITPVDNSEGAQRRLRQLSSSRIQPMVAGIECLPLTSADGSETVLVLSVPRSPDAPHVIGQQDKLGAPYRDGPETRWMRERDLERAYRERFSRRATEEVRLIELAERITERLALHEGAFIVGVAAPRTPTPAISRPPTRQEATKILEDALKEALLVAPTDTQSRWLILRNLESDALNPSVGLRRWVVQARTDRSPDGLSDRGYVELHHDGSVGFASSLNIRGQVEAPGKYPVLTMVAEGFIADFLALVSVHMRHLGGEGSAALRIDVAREDGTVPLAAFDLDRMGPFTSGKMVQPTWTHTLKSFTPLISEVSPASTTDSLRDLACDLAEDFVNQFGIMQLNALRRAG